MSSERGNQQPPFGGSSGSSYAPDSSGGYEANEDYGDYGDYGNYSGANAANGSYANQPQSAAPQRGPLSRRIAAQQNSQPPASAPSTGTYDIYGNYVDYGNHAAYSPPDGTPGGYPVNEADLWRNGQQMTAGARATPQLPAPLLPPSQFPANAPALPVALTPQAGNQGIGEQAALLQASLREYDRMEREVGELTMLVRQTSVEAEQLAQRKTIIAAQVREMDGRIETYSRTEIRDSYRHAAEAEMRAFMIAEQREQLQAKLQAYERYKDHLRRTIDFLRLLPAAISAALSAAQSVAQSATTLTAPAVVTPPRLSQPAQQAQPTPRVQPLQTPQQPTGDQPPTVFIETGEDVTTFLGPLPPAPGAAPGPSRPPASTTPSAPNAPTGPSVPANPANHTQDVSSVSGTRGDALAQAIHTQEVLRQRLAQRLHDGPAQALANVVLATEMCERLIQTEPEQPARALEELGRLKEQVNAALQETRKFIFELRPMALDDLGLVAALRRYTAGIASQSGVDMMVNAPNGEPRLPPEISSALFRIAQEALMNAVAHGHARHALVTVLLHQHHVLLLVDDDGGGFDVEQAIAWAAIRHSTGITGMQERAEMLHGSLRIQSERGRGSRVEVMAPLTGPAGSVGSVGSAGQP
ncbi:MAG: histidine kinase [Ktedonobacterales bacterium]